MFTRPFISVVSAALLAAHAGIGCCAHHMHSMHPMQELACRGDLTRWSGPDAHNHLAACHASAACHADHEHTAPTDHHPSGDHQPGNHHCSEGHCAFLAGSRTCVPELSAAPGFLPILVASSPTQLGHRPAVDGALTDESPALPVRSHLAKQVLII